jgi:hypothetical protein
MLIWKKFSSIYKITTYNMLKPMIITLQRDKRRLAQQKINNMFENN